MRKIAIMTAAALALTSCATRTKVVEVPVTTVVHDTIREGVSDRQTIVIRDSVTVRGDTVERERLVWRTRLVHDTVYVSRSAERSEAVPIEVAAEPRRRAADIDRTIAAALIGALATIAIYGRLRRR